MDDGWVNRLIDNPEYKNVVLTDHLNDDKIISELQGKTMERRNQRKFNCNERKCLILSMESYNRRI